MYTEFKLLSLFDNFNQSPSLGLGQRSGFHYFNGITDAADVVFVVSMDLGGALDDLAISGVLNVVCDGYYDGLVHLIADNLTHSGLSECAFCHFCIPLMRSSLR